MKKILIFVIKTYQYFIEALTTQSLTRGLKLGFKRILKCHPIKSLGGSEGLDFVPGSNKKESKNG